MVLMGKSIDRGTSSGYFETDVTEGVSPGLLSSTVQAFRNFIIWKTKDLAGTAGEKNKADQQFYYPE